MTCKRMTPLPENSDEMKNAAKEPTAKLKKTGTVNGASPFSSPNPTVSNIVPLIIHHSVIIKMWKRILVPAINPAIIQKDLLRFNLNVSALRRLIMVYLLDHFCKIIFQTVSMMGKMFDDETILCQC